jgi:hypothetical protein
MKWCCPVYGGWYGEAGGRGLGILTGRTADGEPEFLLQFRAIEDGEELSTQFETPVLFATQIGILYCPWCGRKLEKWYRKNLDELNRPKLKV